MYHNYYWYCQLLKKIGIAVLNVEFHVRMPWGFQHTIEGYHKDSSHKMKMQFEQRDIPSEKWDQTA